MAVDLEAVYTAYVTGQAQTPSLMLAILASHVLPPSREAIHAALADSPLDVASVRTRERSAEQPLDVEATVALPAGPLGATVTARIGIGPSLHDLGDEVVTTGVDEATLYACTELSVWSVAVELGFDGHDPLSALHAQLAICAAVTPDALAFLDLDAQRLWPAARARAAARVPISVPATEIFSIQAVQHRRGPLWLHTHGLHRCGALELEALDVAPADADAVETLLWASAMRFAEQGTPPPYTPFALGPGLDLAWLPWQDAVEQITVRGHGRPPERDELHRRPSGVLVAAAKGRNGTEFAALRVHAAAVRAGVPLYVSFAEVQRRAAAAAHTIGALRDLVALHGTEDDWGFSAEVGLPGDDGELAEIVMIDLGAVTDAEVAGTLRTAPLVGSMDAVAGSSVVQPAERVVGWTATGPAGLRITQDDALYG